MENVFVKRFQKAHIIVCDACILPETTNHFLHRIADRTDGEYCQLIAISQSSALSYRDFFQWATPICKDSPSARIADDKCSLAWKLSREHEFTQLMLIHR